MTEEKEMTKNIDESKHWESLYYKENALVGVLRQNIKFLEEEVEYLNGRIHFILKYER